MRHVLELPDSLEPVVQHLAKSEGVSPRTLLVAIVLDEIRRRLEVKKAESTDKTPTDGMAA